MLVVVLVVVLYQVPVVGCELLEVPGFGTGQAVSIDRTIDITKMSVKSLINALLLIIMISLFLYFFPIFPCGALCFILAVLIISFTFDVIGKILLLNVMIFKTVGIFVSRVER